MLLDNKESWIEAFTFRRFKAQFLVAKFSPHQREFHTLAYIAEGQFNIRYREKKYTLNAGDSILIPAGEIYSFYSTNIEKSVVYFHYIEPAEQYILANNQLMPDIEHLFLTKELTTAFCNYLFSNIESEVDTLHYKQFILNLLTNLNGRLKNNKLPNNELVASLIFAKNCVADDMFSNFNLDDLSAKCKIDKWLLSRTFKLLFGVSLFSYIHTCRIVKAKELLAYKYSISEVTFECKYSDQSHFSRIFRRHVGITPSQWVKLVK